MDEFELIGQVLESLGEQVGGAAVKLGPGDDSALIEPVPGQMLVSSIDTLVAGTHFPSDASAAFVGYRSLATSVSDLAAMGADPLYCLVAVTLPGGDPAWLREFARGLGAAAFAFRSPVAGGNLARGPLNITVSVHGQVPAGAALMRSGARQGDRVLVSGSLGGAAAALHHPKLDTAAGFDRIAHCQESDADYPLRRYYMPSPRLELGRALRGIASAAIDVSDGLLADLGHICRASGCAAELALEAIPRYSGATPEQALSGGDDYELCVTVPPAQLRAAMDVAGAMNLPLTDIGAITSGSELRVLDRGRPYGSPYRLGTGYRHFQ